MRVHLLHLTLTARSPFGVAAPETTESGSTTKPSLPLATNPAGEPYLPGTSVTGSLREATPEVRRGALFGFALDDKAAKAAKERKKPVAQASLVRILGTQMTPPHEPEVRRRAAIDRHRGAAANRTLYSRQTLPAGTIVEVWLRIDQPGSESPLPEVKALLTGWRPVLGGGRTTGHGDLQLTAIHHRELDLTTRTGLLTWLSQGGPGMVGPDVDGTRRLFPDKDEAVVPLDHRLLFKDPLQFRVLDALHPGSGASSRIDGGTVARVLKDANETVVVPGSTWKGLLRSRVEYVYRSVGLPVCDSVSDDGAGPCGTCDVCQAFGAAKSRTATSRRRGYLAFPDTPVNGGTLHTRNHVALDRVFGGAADKQLFAEDVVEGGTIRLAIRANGNPAPALRAAVVLTLGDLADGLIGVGGGTTRGYGTLAPDEATAAWLTIERPAAQAALKAATEEDHT
ncbi:RAMP superfamily CRISPR-associated protein [Promicromonospora sp. NPDC057138]|uniref:RAMP superfamily CRISPR-associated protein n=1 Tax=Promicromonospora sp. NPDC057138 TaxID=3346031 RepID=UPI003636EAE0